MGEESYLLPNDQAELSIPLIINPLPENTSLKYKLIHNGTGALVEEKEFVAEPGVLDLKLDLKKLELKIYELVMVFVTDGDEDELFSIDLKIFDPYDNKPPLPPANVSVTPNPGKVVLSWQVPDYSPDDEDIPSEYIIYRSTQEDFEPNDEKNKVGTVAGIEKVGELLTYEDNLLGGTYYYIIASVDISGNYAYSEKVSITIEGKPAPVISSESKELFVDEEPILQWEYLIGVSEYIIQISGDESFSSIFKEYSVHPSATSLAITDELEPEKWYWRIKANFSDGTFSDFSVPYSFFYLLTEEESNQISYLVIKPEIFNPRASDLKIEVVLNDDPLTEHTWSF